MREALICNIRRKMAAALACSLLISQLGAAAPAYGAGSQMDREDFVETETITLRGRIVSLAKNYDVKSDIELQLYVNGKPDTTHKPVIVKAEDTREPWDIYDDSIELINDLSGEPINSGDGLSAATGSDAADYDVWEYRFENLPFEDEEGNEYEYTIRDIAYGPATPSNAKASKTASASNLASSSHAVRGKNGDVLFWTNMEGTEVLETGDVEFPAAGARLVYVPYTDVEGIYVHHTDSGEEKDAEADAESAELVTLELECVSEQDEAFLSNDAEVELDTARGIWRAEHLLLYNPLTCAAIDYRVAAVTGREDYQVRYENRGRYAGYGDYAYDGGTIHHERIAPEEAGTYSVKGIITWEDRDNIWNLRPEDAGFLQIYDEDGKDVTGQVHVQTERTDAGNWNYKIAGLTVGKAYTLRQNLPAYDGGNLKDIAVTSESRDAVVNAPAITETLRTRNMRGLIQWSSYNPLVKTTESLDFLQVYEGSRDVTNLVSITRNQNTEEAVGRDVWSYTVEGLVEGRDYIIRAKQLDGYTVNPSEVKAETGMSRNLRSTNRNMGNAALLEPFNIRSTEPVKLTIENRYYGGSELDGTQFEYTLKTGANSQQLSLYNGAYEAISAGNSTGKTKTANNGIIQLKAGEKAVVTLDSGTAYSVEQTVNEQVEVLYDALNMKVQSGTLQEDVTKTFINLKKQTLDYQKQWNDNGDKGGSRPEAGAFAGCLKLEVSKNGNQIIDKNELAKLGLENIKPDITDAQANFWTIHYDHIPVTDENGDNLSYRLVEESIPGYKLTSETGDSDGVYKKILVNTSYTTFKADKIWRDNNNEYTTRDTVEDFEERLSLRYKVGSEEQQVQLQTTDSSKDNYLFVSEADTEGEDSGNTWKIQISNLIQFDEEGMPYAYYLVENTENWTEDKDHYVPSYENSHNYINVKDSCYTGGTITNKLEGKTNFTFTKEWKDGNSENRPTLTFQLMRYPGNLSVEAGYTRAAPVETKTISGEDKIIKQGGTLVWKTGDEELLPRYNADGVKYVYFVKEILSGENSGDYVQHVTTMNNMTSSLDELGLNLVADGEKLTNRLEKTMDIPVTKTWKSAAFQNIDAQVVLNVTRKSAKPGAAEETVIFDPELCIEGFTPETITRTGTVPGVPVYDDDGYLYTYRVTEKEIRIRTPETGDSYIPLVWDNIDQVYKTTKKHYPSQESPIQYKFSTNTEKLDSGEVLLTNALKDTMNVRVDKIWPSGWLERENDSYKHKKPTRLTFTLHQDGVVYSGNQGSAVTNPAIIEGDVLNPYIAGGEQKGICSFNNLPRYDADGHEYVYTVTEEVEGSVGIITYEYSWEYGAWTNDTDKNIDTRVVDVTNPPPGEGKVIWVQKQWLDDGDKPHRENVIVGLYKKANQAWTDTNKQITLTEKNEWKSYFGIDAGENAEDYLIREIALNSHGNEEGHKVKYEASDSVSQEPPTEGTVSTEEHTYKVSHEKEIDGTWTIKNLRTGIVDVTITKEWLDGVKEAAEVENEDGDVTNGYRPANATFQLNQNGSGYGAPQVTKNNRSQKDDAAKPIIKWEDLPKYDENGKLYAYSVVETKVGDTDIANGSITFTDAAGESHCYVSTITGGEYVHSKDETTVDSGDTIPFHAVNKRQDNLEVVVYKVWKDDGEVVNGKRVRPDIHFVLSRVKESEKTNSDVTPEMVRVGKTIDENNSNEYEVKYLFDPVPRYAEDGEEYIYYAEEGMDGNSNQYKPTYYSCEPSKIEETMPSENRFELNHGTGTVVNERSNTVSVSGEKIWKLMGGLENEDYPSVTLRLQSKVMYPTTSDSDSYTDVTYQEEGKPKTYEAVLGTDNTDKKVYDYIFTGPEANGHFPRYNEAGKELQYYVKEVKINGEAVAEGSIYQRTSGDRSFVLENTYMDKGECAVQVTKSWEDVPAGEEGPIAEIKLHRVMVDGDGEELGYTDSVKETKKLKYPSGSNANTTQTVQFTNLPRFAPNGRLYHYYVTETVIEGYSIAISSSEKFSFGTAQETKDITITNTYQPKEEAQGAVISINGIKRWADSSNQHKLRPSDASNIKLTLHRKYKLRNAVGGSEYEDEAVADTTVSWDSGSTTSGNTWTYEITLSNGEKFPKYAPNGTEYIYWVEETLNGSGDTTLPDRYTPGSATEVTLAQIASNPDALSITNTLKTVNLTAKKHWEDSKNLYGTRPESVTLTIQRRPVDSNEDNAWTDYTVNGKTSPETLVLTGTGETWQTSIALPKYDYNNGTIVEYVYRAVEKTADIPAGYLCGINGDAADTPTGTSESGYISEITNMLNRNTATTSITVTKEWTDNNNSDGLREQTEVTFHLWRKAKTASESDWTEVTSQKLGVNQTHPDDVAVTDTYVTWNNLPQYMPGTQNEAEYAVTETMNAFGETQYTSSASTSTKAKPDAQGELTVTNTHAPISDVKITFEKIWDDAENKWETRPDTIDVVLMRKQGTSTSGEPAKDAQGQYQQRTIDPKAPGGWNVTFENLPYASNGTPYTYYVMEGTVGDAGKFTPASIPGYKTPADSDRTEFTPVITTEKDVREGKVTVTNHLDTTEIKARKSWTDSNNAWNTRPDSATFDLFRKVENSPLGYAQISGNVGGAVRDTASITITAQEFTNGAADPANSAFKLKYENLPKTDKDGAAYQYQIRETSMQFGTSTVPITWNDDGTPNDTTFGGYKITNAAPDADNIQTITNTLDIAGSIRVEKDWEDGDNQDGVRETIPSNIKATLYQTTNPDTTDIKTMVSMGEKSLTAETDSTLPWYAEWKDLPKQDSQGNSYHYKVVENLPDNSPYTVSYQKNGETSNSENIMVKPENAETVTITMTNSYTPKRMKVMAEKVWSGDGDGSISRRPESILFELYRRTDSSEQPEHVSGEDQKAVSAQNWKVEWSDLPVYENGEPITYFVKESSLIPGYKTTYANAGVVTENDTYIATGVTGTLSDLDNQGGNAKTITVTNTWTTRTIYAKKVWSDEENRDGLRMPVELELLANGVAAAGQAKKVVDTDSDNTVSWENVPVADNDGKLITYTVGEVTVPDGYNVSYTGSSTDHAGDTANGGSAATPLLITNTHTPERTTYTIEKLWLDDELWKEDVRPDSIQMQLYMTGADGGEIPVGQPVTVRENAAGKWSFTWDDLYKYQDRGKVIRYYAKEIGADGYLSTASGSNALVNRMNTTSLRVSKVWDDMDDYYGMRPDSITILLQRKAQGDTSWTTLPAAKAKLTMDSSSGWGAAELTGLPTHDKQNRPYEYRAVESAIGEQTVTGGKGAGYEVAYEHQPNALTKPGETEITNRLATGSLEVTKTLRGGGNTDFSFLVELTANGQTKVYKGPYRTNLSGDVQQTDADGTITIQGGQKFIIDRIPEGMSYTVTEQEKTGYRQVSKDGDTGVIKAGGTATAEFINQRNSSGGGGGGGGNTPSGPDTKPSSGGPGVVPEEPDGPGVVDEPTQPEQPEASAEPDTTDTGRLPEIPVTPQRRPDIPTGTIVEVRNPAEPNGPPLYRGEYDRNRGFSNIPSGRYELVTLDENGVPLGSLPIYIDDEGVPLALPRTGDRRIPSALLAAALASSAAALAWIGRRRRKKEQE